MKTLKLSVTKVVIAILVSVTTPTPSFAGIPVIDGTNLSQNVLSATEEVAQTIKQVQEYCDTVVAVFYAIATILKYDAEYRAAYLIHLG